jgi:SAM-dependent methyltransferase
MKVFDAYARYYDLLYRRKNYAAEAAYVDSLLRRHDIPGRRLLELGCGTGRHATELASLGYTIHGVDRSEVMLTEAEARAAANAHRSRLTFSHGDVCSVRLDQRFDAAISLFHVMSYQTSDEAVAGMCATARRHLADGGLFLFDCWYGPGVLTDPPVVRVARMADEAIEVTRMAEPVLDTTASTVDVQYDMFVRDSATGQVSEIKESHLMRYLFVSELRGFLTRAGFEPLTFVEWMTDRAASAGTWNLCVVSRCTVIDTSV